VTKFFKIIFRILLTCINSLFLFPLFIFKKLRALFFGIRNAKHRDSEEEFVWKSFIKSLDELKKGLLPKEDFQKIRMFRNVFGEYTGTNPWNSDFKLVPVKHPWIVCLGKAIPSHVLGEVCLKELGENVDVTTE